MQFRKSPNAILKEHEIELERENFNRILSMVSDEELVKKFGVTPDTVSRWRKGKGFPTKARLGRLKRHYLGAE